MPRFVTDQDIKFMKQLNKELLNDIIETNVVVYKLDLAESPTNIYGEAPKKRYNMGVQMTCLINRQDKSPSSDQFVLDFAQAAVFSFMREICEEKDIYPEVGDIIEYDSAFWEINNAAENQLVADQPFYNWAIICTCHLTRRTALQLTERTQFSRDSREDNV